MKKRMARLTAASLSLLMAASMIPATTMAAETDKNFKIATVRWTDSWPIDFLKEGVMAELEEKAGVNLEWQVFYNSDWSEQKSLLLASGDLPDAFLGSICLTASDMAQNEDYFVDLTPYINADIMPNLTAAIEKCPELLAACTTRDGKILSLPKKLPLRPVCCGNALYINQKWLDNLGLATPTTVDELKDVLIAFAQQDADGDGDPTNEIAYTNNAGKNLNADTAKILTVWGCMTSRNENYMGLNNDGEVVFVPAQENYKEAVNWMHELWEAGALDPEYFTQESSAVTAKLQATDGSRVGLIGAWTADSEAGMNASEFTLLEAVEGYAGEHYVEAATANLDVADRELVITTACEDPEALCRWADGFYDNVVSLQTFYGSIGVTVTDNGDGTYAVHAPDENTSLDTAAWSYSLRDFGPKYMDPEFYENVSIPSDVSDGIKLGEDEVNAKYVDATKHIGLPTLHYTNDELSRITAIGTDVYAYAEAMYAHWVVDGGVDDEWDSYIAQMQAMGLDELVELQTNAYAAYCESMQ